MSLKSSETGKPITILTEQDDYTASVVMEWLYAYNIKFERINIDDSQDIKIRINLEKDVDYDVRHNGNSCLTGITWCRRGQLQNTYVRAKFEDVSMNLHETLQKHLNEQFLDVATFIYSQMPRIDSPSRYRINKIDTLAKAIQVGLTIPRTIVTQCKIDLIEYFQEGKALINKPITDDLIAERNGMSSKHGVMLLEWEEVKKLPEQFGLALFQEFVHKDFEIRYYLIQGDGYAVANFCNMNSLSTIDGRRVINSGGEVNRIIPFNMPQVLHNKCLDLLEHLGLESGSFDFIYRKGEFTFLEVNPVGQFGYVSNLGNYYIEKKIAEKLLGLNLQLQHEV